MHPYQPVTFAADLNGLQTVIGDPVIVHLKSNFNRTISGTVVDIKDYGHAVNFMVKLHKLGTIVAVESDRIECDTQA